MEHKHQKVMSSQPSQQVLWANQILNLTLAQNLYEEEEEEAAPFSTTLSSSLGLNLPNPAPEIDMEAKNSGKPLSLNFRERIYGGNQ